MERTQDEIVKRIKERQNADVFWFEVNEYIYCLDFEHAKEFLKEGTKEDKWKQKPQEDVRKEAIGYLEFVWEKANNMRGLSANRSIMHYVAWMWLLGEDSFDDLMDGYRDYGKPQLRRIEKHFGVSVGESV